MYNKIFKDFEILFCCIKKIVFSVIYDVQILLSSNPLLNS